MAVIRNFCYVLDLWKPRLVCKAQEKIICFYLHTLNLSFTDNPLRVTLMIVLNLFASIGVV